MNELEHLKSMWKKKSDEEFKINRTTELIVPKITFSNEKNSLHNENWFYKVPFSYREALDVKYEQRIKNKKSYMVWTQGPILRFKDGDFLTAKNEKNSLQILFSQPMGWDVSKNEMHEGSVTYDYFDIKDGKHVKIKTSTCSQMQFLEMLIYGNKTDDSKAARKNKIEKKLKTQLENSQEIRDVLREIDVDFKLDSGEYVETLTVYLPCKEGVCDHSDLLRVIKQSIMTNFVLSFSEIEKKLSIDSGKVPEELFKKAVRKISKHTAKGELGELLLFTLLEVYFEAPKILSKISLKTARRVPVFGADAVHAQYVDGDLRLYLGESKMHKSFSNAATKAAESISSSVDKYEDEFDLIESHIDFPEMEKEVHDELMGLLNPFTEGNENISDVLHAPCFIGFVEPDVFSNDNNIYLEKYTEIAKQYVMDFYSKLAKKDNDIDKTTLILLPFTSLDNLVEEFISYMGVKK